MKNLNSFCVTYILPELVSSDFTAAMENSLDAIAEGKQPWEQYLIGWNRTYLQPELEKARVAIQRNFPNKLYRSSERDQALEKSRTRCPQCNQALSKVPSKKVKKGYFLKCTHNCLDLVLFWSERTKAWEAPASKPQGDDLKMATKASTELTQIPCPICKKPMEIYCYVKDGQEKQLLRCSDAEARAKNKKHADAVYFQSRGRWWSPKHGEIAPSE